MAVVAAVFYVRDVQIGLIAFLLLPIFVTGFLSQLWLKSHRLQLGGIQSELIEAQSTIQSIRLSVNKDPLTGLYSRTYVRERLEERLLVASKRGTKCAVLYLDLDFFKEFNDALGHNLGNQLLVAVANRLKTLVKKGDILGYQGGDEFIIILQEINDPMSAELVARRIISGIGQEFEMQGRHLSISASIGISVGLSDGSDSEDLIQKAERALIQSKANGRQGYSFYCQSLNKKAVERLKIDQHLRGALERGEFSLVYQAIINEKSKSLKGFEALIRWKNQELGWVSPAEFIPVSEQIGLITELGNWVLRESVQQLQQWQVRYSRPLVMSVNVSPRQFQDESILPAVKTILKQTSVTPSSLQLEVTEGLFLSASANVLSSVEALKNAGIKLALDDFGTGYSSLSYLNKLPFDVLKIDKSFVDGMGQSESDLNMVKAIISIAHGLNMTTVVEGVETPQQVHILRELGADSIQGYYYSKPLSAKEAEMRFLANDSLLEMNESVWDKL
jgi:diguanylate cyclase (GGDEF)-like protein